jgi:sortase A
MSTPRHWLYAAVASTAAFFSFLLLFGSLWVPVKAELAQWLIERSWQVSLEGDTPSPPWPWADTRPVAVLSLPAHGIRQVVLEGNSGRNLAFGPVFTGSTLGDEDWVISGHRDTHFSFLEKVQKGDLLQVSTTGTSRWFEVRAVDIVDSRFEELVIEPGMARVSLVTCYPFDSLVTGGPLRYVVTALPVEMPVSRRPPSSG